MICTWQFRDGRLQELTPPRTARNILIWMDYDGHEHANIMEMDACIHTSSLVLYLARVQSVPHLIVFIDCDDGDVLGVW